MLTLIGDHLWQSTICAGVAWLLTLALRTNHAGVRFWVWFAASMKFLIPFAALVALGAYLPWKPAIVAPVDVAFFDLASQPFSEVVELAEPVAPTDAGPAAQTSPSIDLQSVLEVALPTLWVIGTLTVLLVWAVRWRRVVAVARSATPAASGHEHDILHRLQARLDLASPLSIRITGSSLEPGVVGILHPVLLWPRGISARLTDAQIESILVHELAHVQRRDNLTAALHMLVEAAFWFHPLVWWIGTRLVDERERACDEQVMRVCESAEIYAESILRTCEHHTASPLVCVSGVTGSDLKERIEAIMRNAACHPLTASRRALVGGAAALAVAIPVASGALASPVAPVHSAPASAFQRFAVNSIAPSAPGTPNDGPSTAIRPRPIQHAVDYIQRPRESAAAAVVTPQVPTAATSPHFQTVSIRPAGDVRSTPKEELWVR